MGQSLSSAPRASVRLRLLPVAFLTIVVMGALVAVLVASIPLAIALELALWPTP